MRLSFTATWLPWPNTSMMLTNGTHCRVPTCFGNVLFYSLDRSYCSVEVWRSLMSNIPVLLRIGFTLNPKPRVSSQHPWSILGVHWIIMKEKMQITVFLQSFCIFELRLFFCCCTACLPCWRPQEFSPSLILWVTTLCGWYRNPKLSHYVNAKPFPSLPNFSKHIITVLV